MKAWSVFAISLGIGAPFHRTSMLEDVASGSVMIPMIGSSF